MIANTCVLANSTHARHRSEPASPGDAKQAHTGRGFLTPEGDDQAAHIHMLRRSSRPTSSYRDQSATSSSVHRPHLTRTSSSRSGKSAPGFLKAQASQPDSPRPRARSAATPSSSATNHLESAPRPATPSPPTQTSAHRSLRRESATQRNLRPPTIRISSAASTTTNASLSTAVSTSATSLSTTVPTSAASASPPRTTSVEYSAFAVPPKRGAPPAVDRDAQLPPTPTVRDQFRAERRPSPRPARDACSIDVECFRRHRAPCAPCCPNSVHHVVCVCTRQCA